ncbi:MAG: hypothetical protein ACK56F_23060 [bacterium]
MPRPFAGPADRQLVIRRTPSKFKIQLRVLLTGFPHPAKSREWFQNALALVLNRETTIVIILR